MLKIQVGDITNLKDVDVIINSCKKSLLGGGGVDGDIHGKAGVKLLAECLMLNGCEVGEAKITKGYDLGIPYIIHTAGPVYYYPEWAKEHNYNQAQLLENCYKNSLALAKENNLKKIAFSAIATGAYGYPAKESSEIALRTVIDFLKENPDFEIGLVLYTEELYLQYMEEIKKYDIEYVVEVIEEERAPSIQELKERYKDTNY